MSFRSALAGPSRSTTTSLSNSRCLPSTSLRQKVALQRRTLLQVPHPALDPSNGSTHFHISTSKSIQSLADVYAMVRAFEAHYQRSVVGVYLAQDHETTRPLNRVTLTLDKPLLLDSLQYLSTPLPNIKSRETELKWGPDLDDLERVLGSKAKVTSSDGGSFQRSGEVEGDQYRTGKYARNHMDEKNGGMLEFKVEGFHPQHPAENRKENKNTMTKIMQVEESMSKTELSRYRELKTKKRSEDQRIYAVLEELKASGNSLGAEFDEILGKYPHLKDTRRKIHRNRDGNGTGTGDAEVRRVLHRNRDRDSELSGSRSEGGSKGRKLSQAEKQRQQKVEAEEREREESIGSKFTFSLGDPSGSTETQSTGTSESGREAAERVELPTTKKGFSLSSLRSQAHTIEGLTSAAASFGTDPIAAGPATSPNVSFKSPKISLPTDTPEVVADNAASSGAAVDKPRPKKVKKSQSPSTSVEEKTKRGKVNKDLEMQMRLMALQGASKKPIEMAEKVGITAERTDNDGDNGAGGANLGSAERSDIDELKLKKVNEGKQGKDGKYDDGIKGVLGKWFGGQ